MEIFPSNFVWEAEANINDIIFFFNKWKTVSVEMLLCKQYVNEI